MFRKLLLVAAIVSVLLVSLAGVAGAANPPGQGQPGQSCGSGTAPDTPGNGNPANSPGSPFAGGVSDGKYNVAESQYEVACFQVSQPHPSPNRPLRRLRHSPIRASAGARCEAPHAVLPPGARLDHDLEPRSEATRHRPPRRFDLAVWA